MRRARVALPVQPMAMRPRAFPAKGCKGGVSSFGFSGTIAHTVLRRASVSGRHGPQLMALSYRRRAFLWREATAAPTTSGAAGTYVACWAATPPAAVSAGAVLWLLLPSMAASCVARSALDGRPAERTVALLLDG